MCEKHKRLGDHDTTRCTLLWCKQHEWCSHSSDQCKGIAPKAPDNRKKPQAWHKTRALRLDERSRAGSTAESLTGDLSKN